MTGFSLFIEFMLITVISPLIYAKILADFNGFALSTKRNRLCFLVMWSIISGTCVLSYYLGDSIIGAFTLLYPFVFFAISLIFFKGSVLRKLFWAFATFACAMIAEIFLVVLFGYILDAHAPALTPGSIIRIIGIALNQVLSYLISRIVLKFALRQQVKLSAYEWLLLSVSLFISTGTFVSLNAIIIYSNDTLTDFVRMVIYCVQIGLIFSSCAMFYIVFKLNKVNALSDENKRLKDLYSAERKYAATVKTQFEESRRIRHDIKQMIDTVSVMAKVDNNENILSILKSEKKNLQKNDVVEATDNIYVNAVLTAKLFEARTKSIEVSVQVTKNILDFDSLDLCYLLGNLLDNAIEACDKCSRPYIQIELLTRNNIFEIRVKNTIPPGYSEGGLETSKNDAENHGYGIKSIKRIANKYSGMCDFYTDGDCFVSFILLKKS